MNTYKLTSILFNRMLKITIWIFIAFVVVQIFSFQNTVSAMSLNFYRFEQVLGKAGIGISFIIANVLILAVFTITLTGFFMNSKSIYSIVSLPMKPVNQFISLVIPCILNLVILWGLQMALVILFGKWLPDYYPKMFDSFEYMNNYILLAVVRYNPISFIYPLSILSFLKTFLLLITVPVAVVFAVFTYITRKFENYFIIFGWAFLNFILYGFVQKFFTFWLFDFLLVFLVYMINRSVTYMKRRCIV